MSRKNISAIADKQVNGIDECKRDENRHSQAERKHPYVDSDIRKPRNACRAKSLDQLHSPIANPAADRTARKDQPAVVERKRRYEPVAHGHVNR